MSKTELGILEQTVNGNYQIQKIAKALKRTPKQIYENIKILISKSLVKRQRGQIEPTKSLQTTLLLQLISDAPNIKDLIKNSGIEILQTLFESKTINDISKETRLRKSKNYRKLKKAHNRSTIRKEGKKYRLNEKIWGKLVDFLKETKKIEEMTDPRIPVSSTIYHKRKNKIVFSCKEKFNAEETAFSAYKKHGIKLLLTKNYYTLPIKKLTKREIFLHSLYATEKDKNTRHIIFVALFYLKHKINISHPILNKIKKALKGERVPGYPSLEEMKDRAEVYGIKV